MVRSYDMVALDMDGTLLTSAKTVSPRTRDALRAVRDEGGWLMLASGRPEFGLRYQAERTGLGLDRMLLASCNGSLVCDALTDEVLAERTIEPALIADVAEMAAAFGLAAMSPAGEVLFTTDPAGYQVAAEARANGMRVEAVERLSEVGIPLHKVLLAAEPAQLALHTDELRAALAGRAETALSAPFYFEVNAPGADKGSGLLDACRVRGIDPARVIAFGDNENDIPMLRAAGTGVAMGNALAHVKESAERVTSSNDEDGIARALGR